MNKEIRFALERFVEAKPRSSTYRERLAQVVAVYDRWLAARGGSMEPFAVESIRTWLLELSRTSAPSTVDNYRQSVLRVARYSPGSSTLWLEPIGDFRKPSKSTSRVGTAEAAEMLGLDRTTITLNAKAGEIPSSKESGRLVFKKRDLKKWRASTLKRPSRPRRTWRLTDHLDRIVEQYIVARDLCGKQRERLRRHVRQFEDWLFAGDAAMLRETDSGRLNGWLASLVSEHAPATINGHRQSIIALLRFATPDGRPLPRTDRIRRQREPDSQRVAFTKEELRRLIEAAPNYLPMTVRTFGRGLHRDAVPRHRPDGVPWAIWWEAFVRVGYESGQYLSDLRQIPWTRLAFDGSVSFVRHKTGKSMAFQLSPVAIQAAKRLGDSEFMLPWNYDMAAYFSREFKKFLRTVKGVRVLGPKSIRRAAVTYTYIDQGEEAARILAGHSSFSITAKHYIDWAIARRKVIAPPSLQS